MSLVLWAILPYLVFLVLVGGLIWRYRYDQFGWTTRSSQLYESRILKVASPLFHFSLLAVLAGHIVGLLVPKAVTEWLGVTDEAYHSGALYGGAAAGLALLIGLVLLIYRRIKTKAVWRATTTGDKVTYLVLAAVIFAGILATLTGDHTATGEHHNYRETVSVWFRSLLVFRPDVTAMASATWQFQLHVLFGFALIVMTPFTRLVHAFTVPLHYLFRPYVVYRSADGTSHKPPRPKRAWDRVGTLDNEKSS